MKTYQKIVALIIVTIAIFAGVLYVFLGKDFANRIYSIVLDSIAGEEENPVAGMEIIGYQNNQMVVVSDNGRTLESVLPERLQGKVISYDAKADTVGVIVYDDGRYNVEIKRGNEEFETLISSPSIKDKIAISNEGTEFSFAQLRNEVFSPDNPDAWTVVVYDFDTGDYLEVGSGYAPNFVYLDNQGLVTGLAYSTGVGFNIFDPTTLTVQSHTDFPIQSAAFSPIVSEQGNTVFMYSPVTDSYQAYDMVWSDSFDLVPQDRSFQNIVAAKKEKVYEISGQNILETNLDTSETKIFYEAPQALLPVDLIIK